MKRSTTSTTGPYNYATASPGPLQRAISFEEAKRSYIHRYTMEHVPQWVRDRPTPRHSGGTSDQYYAPQFRTDREWYDATTFPGEGELDRRSQHCETSGQTWPLGTWLDAPYQKAA